MSDVEQRFHLDRHRAASELAPEHIADFQRLLKDLCYGSRFQLLIIDCRDERLREQLIPRIDQVLAGRHLRVARLRLAKGEPADVTALEAALAELAADADAIHLTGADAWLTDADWRALNIRREALAERVPARLLLWLSPEQVARLPDLAPDLWAWRSGVFAFVSAPDAPRPAPERQDTTIDNRSLAQRSRRIAELRAYLAEDPPPPEELRLPLLDELAELYRRLGELDEALRIRTEDELPVYERLGDVREKAVTQGQIADIFQARGNLDEALRIRTEDQLPVYERLGDVRAIAVTHRKIADIEIARGELDTALARLRDECLPRVQALGAIADIAVFQGQIADILQARGNLDEALRIRTEDELPVYERLGDVRAKAVTQGKIADILQARGNLDEALRIRTEDQLPVYERLGDVREKAVTQGKIADILQARGNLDEALRIRTEDELPVYERLGDVRAKAVTQGKIADILQARGNLDEALRIRTEDELPVYERLGDVRAKAVTQGKIADILQARGNLDEALRIRTEDELPVYERLGDVRALLVCRAKIAIGLMKRNAQTKDREVVLRANELLCLALADARRLRIPEAARIEAILAEQGMACGKPDC